MEQLQILLHPEQAALLSTVDCGTNNNGRSDRSRGWTPLDDDECPGPLVKRGRAIRRRLSAGAETFLPGSAVVLGDPLFRGPLVCHQVSGHHPHSAHSPPGRIDINSRKSWVGAVGVRGSQPVQWGTAGALPTQLFGVLAVIG